MAAGLGQHPATGQWSNREIRHGQDAGFVPPVLPRDRRRRGGGAAPGSAAGRLGRDFAPLRRGGVRCGCHDPLPAAGPRTPAAGHALRGGGRGGRGGRHHPGRANRRRTDGRTPRRYARQHRRGAYIPGRQDQRPGGGRGGGGARSNRRADRPFPDPGALEPRFDPGDRCAAAGVPRSATQGGGAAPGASGSGGGGPLRPSGAQRAAAGAVRLPRRTDARDRRRRAGGGPLRAGVVPRPRRHRDLRGSRDDGPTRADPAWAACTTASCAPSTTATGTPSSPEASGRGRRDGRSWPCDRAPAPGPPVPRRGTAPARGGSGARSCTLRAGSPSPAGCP